MELSDAQSLAIDLMKEHNLSHWKFAFNRRKRDLGVCSFPKRTIFLSIHYVIRNEYSHIKNTILHEIAHALIGPGQGHNKYWKTLAKVIGCRILNIDEKIAKTNMPKGKYRFVCPGCGVTSYIYRRPKYNDGYMCRFCKCKDVYIEKTDVA